MRARGLLAFFPIFPDFPQFPILDGMKKDIATIVNHADESEKAIERYLRERVEKAHGVCLKYSNPNESGYPDRLALMPGGLAFFVELKSKGRKPTKLQRERMARLEALGIACYVADSKAAVDEIMERRAL